jgi:anti-sigma B factor antagonist
MDLSFHSAGDVTILALDGRFDAYAAPRVADWLDQATSPEMGDFVIDLANVNFIDSTGLATLVKGLKRCRQQDSDLLLCGLQRPVRINFELTKLDRAFRIFPSETLALASIGQ